VLARGEGRVVLAMVGHHLILIWLSQRLWLSSRSEVVQEVADQIPDHQHFWCRVHPLKTKTKLKPFVPCSEHSVWCIKIILLYFSF
jgi:hypothetical protein